MSEYGINKVVHTAYSTAFRIHLPCLPFSVGVKYLLFMHVNVHYTPALPTPLPSTTLLCTQKTQGIASKMAQDVGMVSKYCVIPILFSWFVRFHPYMCFRRQI